MALNNLAVLLLVRARLLSLTFATTGSTSLAATTTGFTRAAGSFLTDGFKKGMEVTPVGFSNNDPAVINWLSATEIKITGSRPSQAEGSGRTLKVVMPSLFNYENQDIQPVDGRWFADEDYLPGSPYKYGVGSRGEVEYIPTYVLRLMGIAGVGVEALYTIAEAIVNGFPMHDSIGTVSGRSVTVRSDPGPFRGQVVNTEAGRAEVAVTIPLIVRTQNIL